MRTLKNIASTVRLAALIGKDVVVSIWRGDLR